MNLCTSSGPTSTLYYQENKISQDRRLPSPAQMRTIIQKGETTPRYQPVRIRVMTTDKDSMDHPQWTRTETMTGEPHLDQDCLIISISFPWPNFFLYLDLNLMLEPRRWTWGFLDPFLMCESHHCLFNWSTKGIEPSLWRLLELGVLP